MKERALHLFVEGLIEQKANLGCQVANEYKNNKLNVIQLLNYYDDITFLLWRDTPQGHEFWKKLHGKFYEFYMRNGKSLLKG